MDWTKFHVGAKVRVSATGAFARPEHDGLTGHITKVYGRAEGYPDQLTAAALLGLDLRPEDVVYRIRLDGAADDHLNVIERELQANPAARAA